jgi:hypothetical protein
MQGQSLGGLVSQMQQRITSDPEMLERGREADKNCSIGSCTFLALSVLCIVGAILWAKGESELTVSIGKGLVGGGAALAGLSCCICSCRTCWLSAPVAAQMAPDMAAMVFGGPGAQQRLQQAQQAPQRQQTAQVVLS